ncbi:flagellar protein export ATPase FliI [Salsuginibacillus halophilus]|nr:flagellar protein export ATPase FliI [Salsuginibacillus halophilus]
MRAADLIHEVDRLTPYKMYGRVTQVVGLTIEAKGPQAAVGELCYIHSDTNSETLQAEVVGFRGEHVLLMPLNAAVDIAPGSLVEASRRPLEIKVGTGLIGKVIDGLGRPMDGSTLPEGLTPQPIDNEPPNPLMRPRIEEPLSLGVKAVDGCMTVGKGQRVGIFAGSGVGKSTLLAMFTKHSDADINVIALIGERGREVKEFIERDLGKSGMKNTILVVATSDQPALMRIKGAMTATAVAEYFREQGKDVNLLMDSVTRFAMAQREIGLAIGEPPTTKGYTPSVFALLPRLLERSGTSENGTVTAFYTVLVDGDDMNEPVADAVRGILDGHLVLSRELANKGHYPAIHVLQSVSRVMGDIVSKTHINAAEQLRRLLSTYEESEDLIQIGAYKRGSSKEVDRAVKAYPKIQQFLQQSMDEPVPFQETVDQLEKMFGKGE